MDHTNVDRLADWLIRRGLEGVATADLLRLFCEKCGALSHGYRRHETVRERLQPTNKVAW